MLRNGNLFPWLSVLLSRKPAAPSCRHGRGPKKATKNRGRPSWAPSSERVDYEADPPSPLTFNSPPLTLYSPALRVGASKSGVGGDEWKVSSMQISLLSTCQDEPRVSVARLTLLLTLLARCGR